MPSSDIDKVVDGFPHPIIFPINGMPNYEALSDLNLKLNSNASSVHSDLGNGQLGLLALTVSVAVYNTLSNIPFVPPLNPGPTAVIPAIATAAQISNLHRLHTEALARFREYIATDKALKQQLITAIQPMYLRALSHRITGFANVTTRQMLVHLYTNYGRLTPADVQANDHTMKAQYDPNQPIETLFDQIETAIDIADAASAPYSPEQVVTIAYTLVFGTGMFPEACRDWRRLPTADKTWGRFKTDFATAHQEFRDTQLTANQTGYHAANALQEEAEALTTQTADALANLATATASDRTTVANLTDTNAKLTAELTTVNAKLLNALAKIAELQVRSSRNSGNNNNSDRPPREYTANENYCWSHGYKVSAHHTSSTCAHKSPGHKDAATRVDNMGGSQRGKE
jgi:hypothetical protein